MIKNQKPKIKNQNYDSKIRIIKVVLFLLTIYLFFLIGKSLNNSLFFRKQGRVNVLFYGKNTRIFSFGLADGVDYYISFSNDSRVFIPGGYGRYRVGGIGKLALLEKKPEIFKKTFSQNLSLFIDYFFYPKENKVYFGSQEDTDFQSPALSEILLDQTNASIFDRVYLGILLATKKRYSFKFTSDVSGRAQENEPLFEPESFFKNLQGNFYESSYRNERRTVQLIYTKSYKTAKYISQILEGEGIRVVDLTQNQADAKKCQVNESGKNFSKTAVAIAQFFNCSLLKSNTELSDIIFILGKTEAEWEVE